MSDLADGDTADDGFGEGSDGIDIGFRLDQAAQHRTERLPREVRDPAVIWSPSSWGGLALIGIHSGHHGLTFIAALLDELPPPDQDPIPDRMLAGDPVTVRQYARRKTMAVDPPTDGPLVPTHELGDGPKADQPFAICRSGCCGHGGNIIPHPMAWLQTAG